MFSVVRFDLALLKGTVLAEPLISLGSVSCKTDQFENFYTPSFLKNDQIYINRCDKSMLCKTFKLDSSPALSTQSKWDGNTSQMCLNYPSNLWDTAWGLAQTPTSATAKTLQFYCLYTPNDSIYLHFSTDWCPETIPEMLFLG